MGLSHTDIVMYDIRFATKVLSGFWQSYGYADVGFLLPYPNEISDWGSVQIVVASWTTQT